MQEFHVAGGPAKKEVSCPSVQIDVGPVDLRRCRAVPGAPHLLGGDALRLRATTPSGATSDPPPVAVRPEAVTLPASGWPISG